MPHLIESTPHLIESTLKDRSGREVLAKAVDLDRSLRRAVRAWCRIHGKGRQPASLRVGNHFFAVYAELWSQIKANGKPDYREGVA